MLAARIALVLSLSLVLCQMAAARPAMGEAEPVILPARQAMQARPAEALATPDRAAGTKPGDRAVAPVVLGAGAVAVVAAWVAVARALTASAGTP